MAVYNGRSSVVEALLQFGADPNQLTKVRPKPTHYRSWKYDITIDIRVSMRLSMILLGIVIVLYTVFAGV